MPITDFRAFCEKRLQEKCLEQIQSDLKYGLKMEEEVCPILEKYFADTLTKTSQYHASDWVGEEGTFYELKSRKDILPTTYDTTIFPVYKCKVGENNRLILVFHFSSNNHTYYIEYNKEKFSKYECSWVSACRNSDSAIKHYNIPIADLIYIIPFTK